MSLRDCPKRTKSGHIGQSPTHLRLLPLLAKLLPTHSRLTLLAQEESDESSRQMSRTGWTRSQQTSGTSSIRKTRSDWWMIRLQFTTSILTTTRLGGLRLDQVASC